MKKGSWEEFYYDGEPSPLERVIILCVDCRAACMGYHELKWRPVTRSDLFYANEVKYWFLGVCQDCYDRHESAGTLEKLEAMLNGEEDDEEE